MSADRKAREGAGGGMSPHLARQALRARFATITDQVPPEIRGHVGADEDVFYFNYIDKKGGCFSGKGAKQWIMVTSARVAYRATLEEQGTFAETSGSILLPQISFVGMTRGKKAGCGQVAFHQLEIKSSGGAISIAMPTETHATQARQFIEAVLNPQ